MGQNAGQYCRPQGSALRSPVKTCRPGSAPKGCFYFMPFYNSTAAATTENIDFAPVQPAIAVDMVGDDSNANLELVYIQFPFIQGTDNWLPKLNAASSANSGFSDADNGGILFTQFTADTRFLNPWPQGLPRADSDNFLRMGGHNDDAMTAQVARGYVNFWVAPNGPDLQDAYG